MSCAACCLILVTYILLNPATNIRNRHDSPAQPLLALLPSVDFCMQRLIALASTFNGLLAGSVCTQNRCITLELSSRPQQLLLHQCLVRASPHKVATTSPDADHSTASHLLCRPSRLAIAAAWASHASLCSTLCILWHKMGLEQ